MSRFLDMFTFVLPPTVNGASLATPDPYGERAKAVTNAAVAEAKLSGDVFRQPADAGGNAATQDYKGYVRLEVIADGDDMSVLVGPSGLAPTLDPTAVGNSGNIVGLLKNGVPQYWILQAGNGADNGKGIHDSIYVKNRAQATATLRYRVVSAIPGAR